MSEPEYPLSLPAVQSTYPTLHLFAKHGHTIAIAFAIAIVVAGLAAWLAGLGWGWALLGVASAAAAYLLLRCLGELIHLIADAMIPK